MEHNTGSAGRVDTARSSLAELAAVAVVLALGTELIGSGISSIFSYRYSELILTGSVVVFFGLVLIVIRSYQGINGKVKIIGMVPLDKSRNVLSINRYYLSQKMSGIFSAMKVENKALHRIWSAQRFYDSKLIPPNRLEVSMTPSGVLAVEAIEYFVLSSLSTHLTDYFNKNAESESKIVVLERADLPDVLLQNRFIELFSRPMEEREVFGERLESSPGKVVYAIGKDGSIFDLFDLTLPKKAKVKRESRGVISIDTSRFKVTIESKVNFSHGNLPFDFEEFYMGEEQYIDENIEIEIIIDVKFRLHSLILPSGWIYYRWIDSFVDSIDGQVSVERFLSSIGWENALTVELLRERRSKALSGPASRGSINRRRGSATIKRARIPTAP